MCLVQPALPDQAVSERDIEYGVMGAVGMKGRRQILNPRIVPAAEINSSVKYLPVYPLAEGVSQQDLRHLAQAAVKDLNSIGETLPASIREQYDLCDIREAVAQIHFPESAEKLAPARRRIIFEEFFWYQLALARIRSNRQKNMLGPNCPMEKEDVEAFLAAMPFEPTGAQARTIGEIAGDMTHTYPMNRLVHGDVGSGKNIDCGFLPVCGMEKRVPGCHHGPHRGSGTAVIRSTNGALLKSIRYPYGVAHRQPYGPREDADQGVAGIGRY